MGLFFLANLRITVAQFLDRLLFGIGQIDRIPHDFSSANFGTRTGGNLGGSDPSQIPRFGQTFGPRFCCRGLRFYLHHDALLAVNGFTDRGGTDNNTHACLRRQADDGTDRHSLFQLSSDTISQPGR